MEINTEIKNLLIDFRDIVDEQRWEIPVYMDYYHRITNVLNNIDKTK